MDPVRIAISQDKDGKNLSVEILTPRLKILSANSQRDLTNYIALMGDPVVRRNYADGKPVPAETTTARMKDWEERWASGDPFSGLAVYKHDNEFVGHVIVGYSGKEGEAELAFLFNEKFWHQGYGTEAVSAVMLQFVPQMLEFKNKEECNGEDYTNRNVLLYVTNDKQLAKGAFKSVMATVSKDNPASRKIMEKSGMTVEKDKDGQPIVHESKWGPRYIGRVSVEDLCAYSKRFGAGPSRTHGNVSPAGDSPLSEGPR